MNAASVSLRYTQGSSDKVYNVALLPEGDGYLVNFAYGRRGKPLKTGTKTAKPLPYDQAKYAYDKLVNEKMAKGYTEDGSGKPFEGSQVAPDRTGWLPQLLNPVEEDKVLEAIEGWQTVWMQIKHDGERRGIIYRNAEVIASNRRGLRITLDPDIQKAVETLWENLPFEGVLDTEDMGDRLVIFDAIVDGFEDVNFNCRAENLDYIHYHIQDLGLQRWLEVDIPLAMTNRMYLIRYIQHAREHNEEGIVLRQGESEYTPGRPNSGGPCLKLKFYASATCVVSGLHPTKRSVELTVMDEDRPVNVGNCTIPPNYDIPNLGDLVEIKYLYAYRGGSLYQPQYKGVRTDVTVDACTFDQLKFKE